MVHASGYICQQLLDMCVLLSANVSLVCCAVVLAGCSYIAYFSQSGSGSGSFCLV